MLISIIDTVAENIRKKEFIGTFFVLRNPLCDERLKSCRIHAQEVFENASSFRRSKGFWMELNSIDQFFLMLKRHNHP